MEKPWTQVALMVFTHMFVGVEVKLSEPDLPTGNPPSNQWRFTHDTGNVRYIAKNARISQQKWVNVSKGTCEITKLGLARHATPSCAKLSEIQIPKQASEKGVTVVIPGDRTHETSGVSPLSPMFRIQLVEPGFLAFMAGLRTKLNVEHHILRMLN